MAHYYNENDPSAAAWLRELIAAGELPAGDVDDRSILSVDPMDLDGYTQAHFFAGIGGWAYALRLAGWPDDRPIWTGSCPCQPFSSAGLKGGESDPRHLWPAFFQLIREHRPPAVFGEQVASPPGVDWLARVFADLEGEGYATGAADLCAAGVGAPHLRQRLYWVADSGGEGLEEWEGQHVHAAEQKRETPQRDSAVGYWRDYDRVFCADPRGPQWRPVEPSSFPLADGVPARMGRLRGYGNAIVAPLAAEFVAAYMDC